MDPARMCRINRTPGNIMGHGGGGTEYVYYYRVPASCIIGKRALGDGIVLF